MHFLISSFAEITSGTTNKESEIIGDRKGFLRNTKKKKNNNSKAFILGQEFSGDRYISKLFKDCSVVCAGDF